MDGLDDPKGVGSKLTHSSCRWMMISTKERAKTWTTSREITLT